MTIAKLFSLAARNFSTFSSINLRIAFHAEEDSRRVTHKKRENVFFLPTSKAS
jgi:hypothetical protein